MHSLKTILKILKDHKPELQKKYPVRAFGVFGSYAGRRETGESDGDIVVELSAPMGLNFVAMADELETLIGIKTHVVSKQAIKPECWTEIEKDIIYI